MPVNVTTGYYNYIGGRSSSSGIGIDRSQWERNIWQIVGSGSGSGASSGGTAATTVVTPSALATLLDAIPIANDGDVIEPDYHNTLREAVLALAAFLGQGPGATGQVKTYGPALIPFDPGGSKKGKWDLGTYGAMAEGGPVDAWMPVDLPDGVLLQNLSVLQMRDALDSEEVTLGFVPLSDPTAQMTVLAKVSAQAGHGLFTTDSAPVNPGGSSDAAVIAALGTVDNTSNRYFLEVRIKGSQAVLCTIYAFQISYTLP